MPPFLLFEPQRAPKKVFSRTALDLGDVLDTNRVVAVQVDALANRLQQDELLAYRQHVGVEGPLLDPPAPNPNQSLRL